MHRPPRYELTFSSGLREGPVDTVVVHCTTATGPGGSPVYTDDSGIVRAEISDRGEVRMLASGGGQVLRAPRSARPLG